MSILKELSLKDKLWRQIALRICGDKMLADDITQLMYVKLSKANEETFFSYKEGQRNHYVTNCMYWIFLDLKKKAKDVRLEELHYIQDQTNIFEPNDEQQLVLDEFDKLDWVQKELLLERIDKSLRQIEREFNINYGYAYRETTKAKEQIKNNVKKKRK